MLKKKSHCHDNRPKSNSSSPKSKKSHKSKDSSKSIFLDPKNEETLWSALFDKKTMMLIGAMFFSSCFPYFVVNYFKQYGNIYIQDDKFLTFVGSCGLLCSAVGRLLWAPIVEYFGFAVSYNILLVLQFCVAFIIPLVEFNEDMYMIWILIAFLSNGAHHPIYESYWDELHGSRLGTLVADVIYFVAVLGNFINYLLAVFIQGKLV